MAKPKGLELRVVLDTNALYTGSASYLVRKEISDLIADTAKLPDLRVVWQIPSVVRDERHFQMLTEANKFLEPMGKLERLLGHNLNITSDILKGRVSEAVERQVQENKLQVLQFDASAVDWPRLISDAAFRRPPFQVGEKEKGFRDAIIAESFLQLVGSSPSSPSICRLILVSGDELLRSAVVGRTVGGTNVHVLESVEALKGLINTLGSAVGEDFIARLLPRASKLFFTIDDKESLYYKWNIHKALNDALTAAKVAPPAGAERVTWEKWTINAPRFVAKEGQRVTWASRFSAKLKAVRKVEPEWAKPDMTSAGSSSVTFPSSGSLLGLPPPAPSALQTTHASSGSWNALSQSVMKFLAEDQTVRTGAANLDVMWSVSVSTSLGLRQPRLEKVVFIDAIWDQ